MGTLLEMLASFSGVGPCASNVFYILICDLLRIVKNFLNSACRFLVLRPAQVDKSLMESYVCHLHAHINTGR